MTVVPRFVVDDGGRTRAGYRGDAGDCVVRAIAIASGVPYADVYADIHATMRARPVRAGKRRRSPRDGVPSPVYRRYLADRGWTWKPTMQIGSGCTVHVRPDELPAEGRHILRLSGHLAAWIDGALHDTHDSSRDGTRCVYGIWSAP